MSDNPKKLNLKGIQPQDFPVVDRPRWIKPKTILPALIPKIDARGGVIQHMDLSICDVDYDGDKEIVTPSKPARPQRPRHDVDERARRNKKTDKKAKKQKKAKKESKPETEENKPVPGKIIKAKSQNFIS